MEDPALDSVFAALAHPRRRRVCDYLADADDPHVSLDELAAVVAVDGRPGAAGSATDSRSLGTARTTLHHVHLPKLDDADVVEYLPMRGAVRAGDAFPVALGLLRAADTAGRDPDADRRVGP